MTLEDSSIKVNHASNISQYGLSLFIPEDVAARESLNPFLRNLIVTKTGYYEKARGHFIARDGIDEYVMLYCVDGKGWVETGGSRREIHKGEIAFCDIHRAHAYGADNINPWSIHWAHFMGEGVPELLRILGISDQSAVLAVGEKPEIISLMKEAYKTLSSGYSFPNILYASTCFQEFFCYLIKLKTYSGLHNSGNIDVENVINFMLENIHATVSLNQLADRAKMSRYHFSRSFKKNTGYPPMEYFNRLKVQKACELLDTTALDVKEISDLLAFNTPFYFSEVFKKITGYSPRKYKSLQNPMR